MLALIGVVLLQRSEGGLGLGGGGGVSGFMTGRGQANALTRATAILAALFFLTSLVLTLMASYGRAPRSILEGVRRRAPAGQQAPAGQGGRTSSSSCSASRATSQAAPAPGAPAPARRRLRRPRRAPGPQSQ